MDPNQDSEILFHRRRHLIALGRHLAALLAFNLAAVACLMGCISGFSTRFDNLNAWDKRIFNSLSLTFGAIISIGIGWLINEIGRIIRWPLLAKRTHKLDDVDSLLLLGSLGSAAGFLWRNFTTRRRLSGSTLTVALYVLVAISGRLSFALFGLTYNINDVPMLVQTHVIQASKWPEASSNGSIWEAPPTGLDSPDLTLGFALMGLQKWAKPPSSFSSEAAPGRTRSPAFDVQKNLQMDTMAQTVGTSNSSVSYTYTLQNFNTSDGSKLNSNRSVASTASCIQLEYLGKSNNTDLTVPDFVFRAPELPDGVLHTMDFPSDAVVYKDNATTFQGAGSYFFIKQENRRDILPLQGDDPTFAHGEDGSMIRRQNGNTLGCTGYPNTCGNRCSNFLILSPGVETVGVPPLLFSCTSSIGVVNSSDEALSITDKRAILLTSFFAYEDTTGDSNRFCISDFRPDQIFNQVNSSSGSTEENIIFAQMKSYSWPANQTNGDYTAILDSFSDPLFGNLRAETSDAPHDSINDPHATGLWVSGLVARMPIAAIAFIDDSGLLGLKDIIPGSTEQYTLSTLGVDWTKAWIVCGILAGLQIAAITVALLYCRGVVIKDNSALVIGQVLRSVSQEYRGCGLAGKKKLVQSLGHDSEFLYGTVEKNGQYQIDIRRRGEFLRPVFPEGVYD